MQGQAAMTLGLWVIGGLICLRRSPPGKYIAHMRTASFAVMNKALGKHMLLLLNGSARGLHFLLLLLCTAES